MSYGSAFATFYDRLTQDVDYPGRAQYFDSIIRQYLPITEQTILLDLACGTGSLSVALSALGYDVIGVDGSGEMLSEAMSKNTEENRILYLCQPLDKLDLYGTVDVTICALDSLNHIVQPVMLEKTFARVALFTAPGGLFVFDVNTPYKHREILGNNTFVYELEQVFCVWQNTTDSQLKTEIALDFFVKQDGYYQRESECFYEQAHSHSCLCTLLDQVGFDLLAVYAGDTFQPVGETDQRGVYVARKR